MSNIRGLIKGYFDLVNNVVRMPKVTYADTLIMRLKITRVMLSWYIRNGEISGLANIVRLFARVPIPTGTKGK